MINHVVAATWNGRQRPHFQCYQRNSRLLGDLFKNLSEQREAICKPLMLVPITLSLTQLLEFS
ncbi:hypothetical protein CL52_20535 [Stutzerimonas balearica DSM 6083]|uniref:Uncharacterized protein n=1 Tax=Stutzerimonas balearica DSM 6083 TaxID=1123016 RepID=A0A8D3Y4X0_9GAMM|nr:hypothetical protein CL52_20535 [Stutzerimonas balearica DSM 6083]